MTQYYQGIYMYNNYDFIIIIINCSPLATGVCVLSIALIRSGVPHLSSVVIVGFDDGSVAAYSKVQ